MPTSATYLANCRTAIAALAELSAFRTAGTLSAQTRAARDAQWGALYLPGTSGTSAAQRLRQAVRNVVNAEADKTGNVTLLEREETYRTLVAEVVPTVPKPKSAADELAELNRLIEEDKAS